MGEVRDRNKRVVVTRFGGPEVIDVVADATRPVPGPGEARVRVQATSAIVTDAVVRKGIYPLLTSTPPFTPGYDLVGVVDAVGPGAAGVRVGDRVADITQVGANAAYVCRPAAGLLPVPADADAAEAACLVLSYLCAYQMLVRVAGVTAGQRVLVNGGSGAVGTGLVQLARQLGAEVVATASADKLDLLAAGGATPLDYRAADLPARLRAAAGDGFDAAFDAVGVASFRRSFRLLRRGGTLVTYGTFLAARDTPRRTPLRFLRFGLHYAAMRALVAAWRRLPNGRSAAFYGNVDSRRDAPAEFAADLAHLFTLLAAGRIKPVVERLALDDARLAHERIDAGRVRGQVVFVLPDAGP